jgi:hypothetical protein
MSAKLELQGFIYDILKNSNLGAPVVVDEPDQNQAFPYVVIGDMTSEENGDNCAQLWTINATINVWSRGDGYKEVKEIQDLINDNLRWTSGERNGYRIVKIFPEDSDVQRDGDGITRQGIQTFRAIVSEV